MIYDKIENIGRYDLLKQVKNFDLNNYQKGKFDVDGDDFFGIGLEYDTKDESDCLWEAHKKYLDIHVILDGEEQISISETDTMHQTMEFDYNNDYQLFEGKGQQVVLLRKGEFLALYPNECHQTAVKVGNSSSVKKIVFKLKI